MIVLVLKVLALIQAIIFWSPCSDPVSVLVIVLVLRVLALIQASFSGTCSDPVCVLVIVLVLGVLALNQTNIFWALF